MQALGAEAALLTSEGQTANGSPSDMRQAFAGLLAELSALQQAHNRAARSLHHERLISTQLKAQASRGAAAAQPGQRPPLQGSPVRHAAAANGWGLSKGLFGAGGASQGRGAPLHAQQQQQQQQQRPAQPAAGAPRPAAPVQSAAAQRPLPHPAAAQDGTPAQPGGLFGRLMASQPAGAPTQNSTPAPVQGFASSFLRSFTDRNQPPDPQNASGQ